MLNQSANTGAAQLEGQIGPVPGERQLHYSLEGIGYAAGSGLRRLIPRGYKVPFTSAKWAKYGRCGINN